MSIDSKDVAILEILQTDGRIALSELGRAIGLSQPAVSERVKKLEEQGVISGYGARINLKTLGLGVTAIIRVQTSHAHIKKCLAKFRQLPNVLEVNRVTGVDCFIVKVVVRATESLEDIVDQLGELGSVTTCVVLSSEPNRTIDRALIQ